MTYDSRGKNKKKRIAPEIPKSRSVIYRERKIFNCDSLGGKIRDFLARIGRTLDESSLAIFQSTASQSSFIYLNIYCYLQNTLFSTFYNFYTFCAVLRLEIYKSAQSSLIFYVYSNDIALFHVPT